MNFEINKDKFRELVLYVCGRADRKDLGAIKLNKILWLSDLRAYLNWGSPISGENYIKQEHGPVANHLPPTLKELIKEQKLVIREEMSFEFPKKEFIALRKADLSFFTPDEVSLVDETIDFVCQHTAESISRYSHNLLWQMADIGEEIPYEAAFAMETGEITEKEVGIAKERLREIL